ncbi:MAG: biopolymer transporter ExbD [Burkholderiales bacterium]|nr:biopolymer transporter ExbD [Burkholderiales bacterium]
MAFGGFDRSAHGTPQAEINMIPLIDVMLVLLVIFIVTAPLLTHAVKIDLPRASSSANQTKPDNVQLGIFADGRVFWNGSEIDAKSLPERFAEAARMQPPPELHLRAERAARYELVAQTMSAAAKAGIQRIGFVTDPGER